MPSQLVPISSLAVTRGATPLVNLAMCWSALSQALEALGLKMLNPPLASPPTLSSNAFFK